MKEIKLLIGHIIVGFGGAIWRGFVLSLLWTWFAVPLGIPQVSIAFVLGFECLVRMLSYTLVPDIGAELEKTILKYTPRKKVEVDDSTDKFVRDALLAVFVPLVFLVTGYIFHLLG